MDALSFESLKTAAVVILILLGGLGTLGKGVDVIRGFRKPRADQEASTNKRLDEQKAMLDNDKRRLDAHEAQLGELRRMEQVQCVAMKALLSHEINGNSVDKLRLANDQLDAFLIGMGK